VAARLGPIAAPPKRRSPLARLLPERDLAETLYGTVLVTAVLVGVSEGGYSIGEMEVAVFTTAVVFALAHGWARALRAAVGREWAMVRVTTPTVLALGLAWAGVWSTNFGINLAIAANLCLLFIWGAALDHRAGAGVFHVLAAGLLATALGLALVVLKILVH
jgi:hypothetical protein